MKNKGFGVWDEKGGGRLNGGCLFRKCRSYIGLLINRFLGFNFVFRIDNIILIDSDSLLRDKGTQKTDFLQFFYHS